MTAILITYQYSRALQDSLYVERGARITSATEKFGDEDLTPAAREAALAALSYHPQYSGTARLATLADAKAPGALTPMVRQLQHASVYVAEVTTDALVSRSEALAEVERQLVAAAELAPEILTARQQHEQQEAAAHAARLATAVDEYLAKPLEVWLEGSPGDKAVATYVSYRLGDRLPSTLSDLLPLDPRLGARAEEARAYAQRLNDAWKLVQQADAAALAALVHEHGTPDQVERYEAGVLPKTERDALVQAVLFAPLAEVPRYEPIDEAAVAAVCDCDTDDVRFSCETVEEPELDADEFARLKVVRAAAPAEATIEVRDHVGYDHHQRKASDPEIRRSGIRVTVVFAGKSWSREYALS